MATETISSVKLYLSRATASSGYVDVELYNADTDGHPNGAILTTASIVQNTIPASGGLMEFPLSYATTVGQKYAIVLRWGSTSSWVVFWHANISGYFASEHYTTVNQSTDPWLTDTDNGLYLEVLVGGTPKYASSGENGAVGGVATWATFRGAVAWTAGGGSVPSKPTNPSPANGVGDQRLNLVDLSWSNGGEATSYNVYAQTDAGGTLSQIASLHPNEYITLPWQFRPNYEQTYSWRVDAVNASGVTTGDVWTWDTMSYSPLKFNPAGGGYADIGGGGGASGYMPGGAIVSPVTRLIVAADNKIWYEDV